MVSSMRRVRSAWYRHGPLGFVPLVARNIAYQLRRAHRGVDDHGDPNPFDSVYASETSAIREIGSLDIESPNARYAVRYQPSPDPLVRSAIAGLDIDHARFTFIDFGSGKGRVLLLAAGYPFKEVIGIEFCKELNDVALRNCANVPPHLRRCGKVSPICFDAAEFELPVDNLICYFYNPFGSVVLAPIAHKLASLVSRGCRVIVIYIDPEHRDLFHQAGFKTTRHDPPLLVLSGR